MTSLVTGATGFVGRHLLSRLAAEGQAVRAMYSDEARRQQYLTHGETAIAGDICDPAVMRKGVSSADVHIPLRSRPFDFIARRNSQNESRRGRVPARRGKIRGAARSYRAPQFAEWLRETVQAQSAA